MLGMSVISNIFQAFTSHPSDPAIAGPPPLEGEAWGLFETQQRPGWCRGAEIYHSLWFSVTAPER